MKGKTPMCPPPDGRGGSRGSEPRRRGLPESGTPGRRPGQLVPPSASDRARFVYIMYEGDYFTAKDVRKECVKDKNYYREDW
jgi:hypothetical protein